MSEQRYLSLQGMHFTIDYCQNDVPDVYAFSMCVGYP